MHKSLVSVRCPRIPAGLGAEGSPTAFHHFPLPTVGKGSPLCLPSVSLTESQAVGVLTSCVPLWTPVPYCLLSYVKTAAPCCVSSVQLFPGSRVGWAAPPPLSTTEAQNSSVHRSPEDGDRSDPISGAREEQAFCVVSFPPLGHLHCSASGRPLRPRSQEPIHPSGHSNHCQTTKPQQFLRVQNSHPRRGLCGTGSDPVAADQGMDAGLHSRSV